MPSNQLHPIYHCHSSQPGSRIDLESKFPADLDDAEMEELLDILSEPPKFIERISPVSTVIGNEIVRGKNWTEMSLKAYRNFLRVFSSVSFYIRQALSDKFGERAMLPFSSMALDPDTLHRMVELDYEQSENTYSQYMELFKSGVMSPAVCFPFGALLPDLPSAYDRRIAIRIGFLIYWRIVEIYHRYLRAAHGEQSYVVPIWLTECAYSEEVLQILHEEFTATAKAHKVKQAHMVLLLDNQQSQEKDTDILMKVWNQVRVNGDVVTVIFRDKNFSEWVTYSNPSVKKLIDRTIAKVDSDMNAMNVDYCWSHFEDIESLAFSSKSAMNFEQKIVKLAQLSYMAVSPDVYVRRKATGQFGKAANEPQEVAVRSNTGWADWHTRPSLGRWHGTLDSNAYFPLADESRPFMRRSRTGKVQENGAQCWKIAWTATRETCVAELRGNDETMQGGFLGVLAEICGHKDLKIVRRNVQDFLVNYTLVHFREHFIQHDLSEADVHITSLVDDFLLKDCKKRLEESDYVVAAAAAQGYYLLMDSYRYHGTHYENLDQRAMYQNVAMLTLAFTNQMTINHWQGKTAANKHLLEIIKRELLDFGTAFTRYCLPDYGVTRQEWDDAMKPFGDDTKTNVVERATRRVAARHLRKLGYKKDFTADDEYLTTTTGHIWTAEIENTNYKWENKLFCGLREE